MLFKLPTKPGIETNLTCLLGAAIADTKSAPKDLRPFFRSSNKKELTRPDFVLTAMAISSSPGANVSTEIFLVEF
ncbi:unannotated protein [freshwater metagenome]|uniref:Unannotated protein n=1 Tax=freshwater metagenome TaxID=449393 RepID=A0A6J7QGH9_9ZZZZ